MRCALEVCEAGDLVGLEFRNAKNLKAEARTSALTASSSISTHFNPFDCSHPKSAMSDERRELEGRSLPLRKELKDWERQFEEKRGKKPTREDIKANSEIGRKPLLSIFRGGSSDSRIATKYKEYDKIQRILKGELSIAKPPKPERKRKRNATTSESSKRAKTEAATPKKRRTASETQEEHQSHEETSPVAKPTMIGPTPQKDGKFLGMFDLLSPEKSPSESRPALGEVSINIAATPSKVEKHSKDLGVATPARGSRTPASSSKRFFLENFMTPMKQKKGEEGTPRTSRKLFATPSFLRRDHVPFEPVLESPEAPRVFKRKPFDRTLSSRMEEIRRAKEAESRPREDTRAEDAGQDYEDELEAMREMEEEERQSVPTIVEDSQAGVILDADGFVPSDLDEVSGSALEDGEKDAPKRPWKKKGQKRQTKRVTMKPVLKQHPKSDAGGDQASTTEPKKGKTNANATAHANFRKLKIKNKNSKAKGRFGRRR